MRKTIEATWREGFLNPDALVAPKVNDLYTRKSSHIVDRIQRAFDSLDTRKLTALHE